MKKGIVGLSILAGIWLLGGCGQEAEAPDRGNLNYGSTEEKNDSIVEEEGYVGGGHDVGEELLSLRIVDGAEEGELLLAGESGGDVYRISLPGKAAEEISVFLDGQSADSSVLEDGMMVEIVFEGGIMETYPAQIGDICSVSAHSRGTEQNPGGGYYDLCGFYLQVLEDLWEKDEGLNGGIQYVSVDLSQAPGGLTEGEKAAVAWRFAELHQAESLTMSYQELLQNGYLEEAGLAMPRDGSTPIYQWEDGLLFTITPDEEAQEGMYSLPTLCFQADKWRSPLGAYGFYHCFAVWPEMGTWTGYTVEAEFIS